MRSLYKNVARFLPLLFAAAGTLRAATPPSYQSSAPAPPLPYILLPLDTGILPSAAILLKELDIYLSPNKDEHYQRNCIGIHHHLSLLQQHYQKEAQKALSQHQLWSHSEHFLEKLPAYFLDTLVDQQWRIKEDALLVALHKLDSLLPADPLDMIDCAAGKPMGQILRLLAYQQSNALDALIERYRNSQDEELASAALCAALISKGLPEATYKEYLINHCKVHRINDLERLNPEQRRYCTILAADEGLRQEQFAPWVSPSIIIEAAQNLKELGLSEQAQLLQDCIVNQEGKQKLLSGDDLHMQSLYYSNTQSISPTRRLAEHMLQHQPSSTKHEQP